MKVYYSLVAFVGERLLNELYVFVSSSSHAMYSLLIHNYCVIACIMTVMCLEKLLARLCLPRFYPCACQCQGVARSNGYSWISMSTWVALYKHTREGPIRQFQTLYLCSLLVQVMLSYVILKLCMSPFKWVWWTCMLQAAAE